MLNEEFAAGLGDITDAIFKHFPCNAKENLVNINKIWITYFVPKISLTVIVIQITKAGNNPQQITSYRPISLTCVSCKISWPIWSSITYHPIKEVLGIIVQPLTIYSTYKQKLKLLSAKIIIRRPT